MAKVVGGKIPPKEHAKLKVEDHIEFMFDKLVFAKSSLGKNVREDCKFLPHQMGPMWTHFDKDPDTFFFSPDQINDPELVWPVEVGLCTHNWDREDWGNSIQCMYFQSVPAKKLRGGWRHVGRKNIGVALGYLHDGDQWTSAINYGAWHFGKWMTCQRIKYDDAFLDNVRDSGSAPIQAYKASGEDDIGFQVGLGQSMALTYRYQWGAQFSLDGSVRLIIPTTPRGILELFNDRDKPEDRDRRAALRHWVNQHARQTSSGNFTHVRSHLRGELSFQWRGFDVRIVPSKFDDEQAAA